MTRAPQSLLPAFVEWASAQQRAMLEAGSSYVAKLQVGKPTNNRAVTLTIERFKVEPTGWIGDELEQGGILTIWENGCADADWAVPADLEASNPSPSYQEHWDDLRPADITTAFARFTNKFEGL